MATPEPVPGERETQVQRTRTGILVLLVGALLSWIPFIGLVGSLLTILGAVLVILGRGAFGPAHGRNILVSIGLFVLGVCVAVGGTLVVVLVAGGAVVTASNEFEIAAALQEAFTGIVLAAAIGAFLTGLASIFFTYELQKREGRLLLGAAYVATIAVQYATLLVVLPALSSVARDLAHAIATGGPINVAGIGGTVNDAAFRIQLFQVIPASLYAAANYLAWTRLRRVEIPAPSARSG